MTSTSPRVTVIGDIGVDLVMGPIASWPRMGTETLMERSEMRAGGSAGNAALAISYLGGDACLITAVGNDDFGTWLQTQFRGVKTCFHRCDRATTLTVGLLHSHSERTFFTTLGHLEEFAIEHVLARLPPWAPEGGIALLCGPFLTPGLRKSYPKLLSELRARGFSIALDIGWPPVDWSASLREEVFSWIAQCDYVLVNELEVTMLSEEADPARAMRHIAPSLRPGASLVVKMGASGARAWSGGREFASSAPIAQVFDTVGAGDSFNAGYLLAISDDADPASALAAGCATATGIIARFPRRGIAPGEFGHCVRDVALRKGARA